MLFLPVYLIAGVKRFDAEIVEENQNDPRNCRFLQLLHSANTRRTTSRTLTNEQYGENHQREAQAHDAHTLTLIHTLTLALTLTITLSLALTLTLTVTQVRTTKERLKPVMRTHSHSSIP